MIPSSYRLLANKNCGDSKSTYKEPYKTIRFGKLPKTIINFQLVSINFYSINKNPINTPYIFPIDIQKFINIMPVALYLSVLTYANITVEIATVKPNEKP